MIRSVEIGLKKFERYYVLLSEIVKMSILNIFLSLSDESNEPPQKKGKVETSEDKNEKDSTPMEVKSDTTSKQKEVEPQSES